MLMANVALFLARLRKNVVAVDFDLEAPGLHHKFSADLPPIERGLVDYLLHCQDHGEPPPLDPYLYDVRLPKGYPGGLRLLPAGNAPSRQYAEMLAKLDWCGLFPPAGGEDVAGPQILLHLKQALRADLSQPPDYLLIDLRTGITELARSSLCVLADAAVFLFLNNPESRAGTRAVLQRVREFSRRLADDPIRCLPVLSRVSGPSTDSSAAMLKELWGELTQALGDTRGVARPLLLHTDPSLELREVLRFREHSSYNDCLLLSDYFRVFAALDTGITPDAPTRSVLEHFGFGEQAEGDDKQRTIECVARGVWRGNAGQPPVLERIRERGRLRVLPPEFISSPEGGGPASPAYDRLWRKVAERLSPAPDWDPVTPDAGASWDLLGAQVREGVLDLCAEPYYLTATRSRLVSVVQLGWLRSLVCAMPSGSTVAGRIARLGKRRAMLESLEGLKERERDFDVGVFGETAASSEAYAALPSWRNRRTGEGGISSRRTVEELANWLIASGPRERVVVCDVSVFAQLRNKAREKGSLHLTSVQFERSVHVPVGLMYPLDDRAWRKQIAEALAWALMGEWSLWAGVESDFARSGIEALSPDELRIQLERDMTFEEAVGWRQALDQVVVT
jgi:hypothetical protein